jgi:rubrerythrin
LVDFDWNALNAFGTAMAALIALLAYRSARHASEAERKRNERQAEIDAAQQQHIGVLADAVRAMADMQGNQIRDLGDRLAEVEAKRDPAHADQRRRAQAEADDAALTRLRDLDQRLEKVKVLRRDGLAGGGWSDATLDGKRVIRLTSKPKAPERKCPECGRVAGARDKRCRDCDHELT